MCFLSVSSLLVIRVGLPLFVTFSPMGCPFCRSMCEVSPWLEVFPKNCVCLYSDMIKEQPSVYRTYHPLLPFYSTADRVVLCYKKKITSVELCWSTFITFKCYCVFLLIDEKCLGLISICFDSAEVALIWNQFALSSLNEWVTRGNPGAVTLDWASLQRICRISINVEPGCVFSIKPMGASGLCKHTSLFHQMQLLASCSLDPKCPARTQKSNAKTAAVWRIKMWHLFVY